MENWRELVGWEGVYDVSDQGNIKRRGAHANLTPSWSGTRGKQYLACNLSSAPRRKTIKVHCAVAEAFIGPKPDGSDTAHINGDRSNNTLGNLTYLTPSQNNLQKRDHGTMSRGEDRPNALLDEQTVLMIRYRAVPGCQIDGYAAIARELGVSADCVAHAAKGRNWGHVDAQDTCPEHRQPIERCPARCKEG